ncbi:MAG TPA: ATP-dependent helicase [Candidatus Evtepia excrementipullorum]|nr:ATP-dependent helicase [Candidatus Evtepia excrementipullorum]
MEYEAWKATWKAPLNPQQEAAVQAAQGPVLLLAVPGSGKTTVLIHRLGYLIFCLGVAPEQILTVTYTVAATRDMAARFARTFGETWANRLEFRTINGLSARIIQHYERVKGRQAFTLVTEEGRLASLVGELYRKATGEFATESTVRSLRTAITYCKNRQMTQEEIEAYQVEDIPFAKLYRQYHAELRRRRWMDYDDQMVYAAQILRQHGDILAYFQDKYRYLCVDEAQDTSRIQHTILKLLAGRRQNLFLVGDEDQSIYGFRAADPGALLRFEEEYPGGRVLFLEKNYRSTATIVAAADRFIRQNQHRRDKHMVAARGPGPAIQPIWVADRVQQYAQLAQWAQDCDRETAVLYRNNDSALPLLDLLDRQGTGCRCRQMEGTFFTHRVVRDVTDFIAFAAHPADGERFFRLYYKMGVGIPKAAAQWAVLQSRGEGNLMAILSHCPQLTQRSQVLCQALAEQFAQLLDDRGDEAIHRLRHHMGYGDFLSTRGSDPGKLAILEALGRYTPNPSSLVTRLGELRERIRQGDSDPNSPFLLSTIHGSKGLEYQRVILMDVADGVLPLADPPLGDHPDPAAVEAYEEERRLFYVAMTRAKEELFLFRFRRSDLGSTFARDLFPDKTRRLRQAVAPRPKGGGKPAPPPLPDLALFDAGAPVTHRAFGRGEVVSRQGDIATILFQEKGEKKVSLSVALRQGQLRRTQGTPSQ